MESGRISHLIHRLVHGLNDGRSDGLGHIADTQTDNVRVRMGLRESADLLRNVAEKITARQFLIIGVDFVHFSVLLICS